MEKRYKVLIVDDEEEFASALAERLILRGFESKVEIDGESALVSIEKDRPDVVILDIKMPGIGGFEVLRRIKLSHPQLPVILLTGYGSTNNGMKGMELGAYDYLIKPVDIKELIRKIEAAITNSKSLT